MEKKTRGPTDAKGTAPRPRLGKRGQKPAKTKAHPAKKPAAPAAEAPEAAPKPPPPRPFDAAPLRLPPADLSWSCEAAELDVPEGTDALPPAAGIVGQPRATEALELGLKLRGPGYHVYVAGLYGTGRSTTIRRAVEGIRPASPPPPDLAFVMNFRDPDRPLLLTFDRGEARPFAEAMARAVARLRREIPRALESEALTRFKKDLAEKLEEAERGLWEDIEKRATELNYAILNREGAGPIVLPIVDGLPKGPQELATLVGEGKLDTEAARKIQDGARTLAMEAESAFRRSRDLARDLEGRIEARVDEVTGATVADALKDVRARFAARPVRAWLDDVERSMVENASIFADGEDDGGESPDDDPLQAFVANVIADHGGEAEGSYPIILERHPTFSNIFGTIERRVTPSGHSDADHTNIKAGALLRANGGYLILEAEDLIRDPDIFETLKRTLADDRLQIQDEPARVHLAPSALKPDPIPVDLKVVVVGDTELYHILWETDEEFRESFKVLAEFDDSMLLDPGTAREFLSVVAKIGRDESLRPLDRSGAERLIGFATRLAGRRDRISTRFGEVADLLREANHVAASGARTRIAADDVERAIEARRRRHARFEIDLRDDVKEGFIRLDLAGTAVGQTNGLVVIDTGPHSFGRPVRITASVAPGHEGLLNVEREAKLSGGTFDKALMILGGYLRRHHGAVPISITASLTFEQTYNRIEGDSASVAEAVALLSALADLPVRQDLAFSGSIDQVGNVQAVGGINEKVEGFFDHCRDRGLTGTQGVVIPVANKKDLMLRSDVVAAAREGRFFIYAVTTVDQAAAVAMGVVAGEVAEDGLYPQDTIQGRVYDALMIFAERLREAGAPPPPEGADGDDASGNGADNGETKAPKKPKKKPAKRKKKRKK